MKDLLRKYDVQAPRYTSYPTVPYWNDSPTTEEWIHSLKTAFKQNASWSMYLHVPFCESLCTFCGCNTMITKNHSLENGYVNSLLKEWDAYKQKVPEILDFPLQQMHLGGGTPTFLAASELKRLVSTLLSSVKISKEFFDGSIEVDPRRTKEDQLQVLRELGFKRVSLGVQDFDENVQRLVNRVQSFDITKQITDQARAMGYDSVNFDLIYGLPKQTVESFSVSIEKTIELRPDRIALYSFALVPWIKPAQRLFKDEDLPEAEMKRALFESAREMLMQAGYKEIGMDHFALEHDSLNEALKNKKLHRNFMGYTEVKTDVLLGLGVSSISETPTCFHQNEKVLPVYERRVNSNEIPTLRGHKLTQEDQDVRKQILDFMTLGHVQLTPAQVDDVREFLKPLVEDQLVQIDGSTLSVLEKGKPFLRNACMALDVHMRKNKPDAKVFSRSV